MPKENLTNKEDLTKVRIDKILSESGIILDLEKKIRDSVISEKEAVVEYIKLVKVIKLLVSLEFLKPLDFKLAMKAVNTLDIE